MFFLNPYKRGKFFLKNVQNVIKTFIDYVNVKQRKFLHTVLLSALPVLSMLHFTVILNNLANAANYP